MTNAITIRKATNQDIELIANYNMRLASETENKTLDRITVLKGIKAVLHDPLRGFYLVAEKNDSSKGIIGQLMITFEWSDWRNKYFWWIQSVYVDQQYRDQKVFTSLYQEIMRLVKSNGTVCGLRLYVEEHNESAKKVYKALGMTKASYEIYEMSL